MIVIGCKKIFKFELFSILKIFIFEEDVEFVEEIVEVVEQFVEEFSFE